ncbi:hypothetical protein V6N13_073835 [Hibiscus sabdariffa]
MTRRKVELVWITNLSARRASLGKRRVGLLKMVEELITLCGIKPCLVMYSPGDVHGRTTFQVDPSKGDVPLQPPPQGPVIPYYDIDGSIAAIRESEMMAATSKAWDNWFHNIMNPNESRGGGSNRSIRSYMGLTHYNPNDQPHRSSVAPHLGLPRSSIGGSSSIAQLKSDWQDLQRVATHVLLLLTWGCMDLH